MIDERDGENDPDEPRRRQEFRPPQGNGIATAALVLGVLALCGGITSIPGLVCGIIGLTRSGTRDGSGKGMAIAGIVLSVFGMLSGLPIMIGLLLPAVQKVREASSRMASSNNLKLIAIAQWNYESTNATFPMPYYYGGVPGGEPERLTDRLSWRVAILPYVEQESLYKGFRPTEAWNSAANRPHANRIVLAYADPDAKTDPTTRYRIFYGGGAAYSLDRPVVITGIADGSSNTINVIEGGEKVTWSQFDEYPFSMDGPLPKLGRPGASVIQAAMFDGSVRSIKPSIDPKVLKSGIHASDGLPLGE